MPAVADVLGRIASALVKLSALLAAVGGVAALRRIPTLPRGGLLTEHLLQARASSKVDRQDARLHTTNEDGSTTQSFFVAMAF